MFYYNHLIYLNQEFFMAHANLQYISYQLVKYFLQMPPFAKGYFQHFQGILYSKN